MVRRTLVVGFVVLALFGSAILAQKSPTAPPPPAKKAEKPGQRIALVLQGGGAFGAFQMGVLEVLYNRGFRPAIIVGTSVGALNGAKLAEGYDGVQNDLRDFWMSIRGNESIYVENPRFESFKRRVSRLEDAMWPLVTEIGMASLLPPLGHLVALEEGLDVQQESSELISELDAVVSRYKQTPLAELVTGNLNLERVANSGIHLRLAAMSLSGFQRYFTQFGDIESEDGQLITPGRQVGPALHVARAGEQGRHVRLAKVPPSVGDGVMASSAIPIIFEPWTVQGGEAYWDGAVRESLPLRKAFDLGATDVIAIMTGPRARRTVVETNPRYSIVVHEVHAIDQPDDGSGADYYARVRIGDYRHRSTPYIEDKNNPTPDWGFDLDPTNLKDMDGRVALEIWDHDDPDADNQADANPEDGARQIRIRIDPSTGHVSGDVEGQAGDKWIVRGSGDGDRVEVVFSVQRRPKPSSFARLIPADVMPIRMVAQLADQFHAESAVEDQRVLEPIDVLHDAATEVGQDAVLRAMRSSPTASKAMQRALTIPRYLLLEAPVVVGNITDFDPEMIRLNHRIGLIVGNHTRLGLLGDPVPDPQEEGQIEARVRSEVLRLLRAEADRWKETARRGVGTDPLMWKRYEYVERAARLLDNMNVMHPTRSRLRP